MSSNDALEESWLSGAESSASRVDDEAPEVPPRVDDRQLRIAGGFFAAALLVALMPVFKAAPNEPPAAVTAPPRVVAVAREPEAAAVAVVAPAAEPRPLKAIVKKVSKLAKRHATHAR